jgi:aspartyl-tRNA(Asn)/glutamyl-tRNA(Gln) amidotransferase subunit B
MSKGSMRFDVNVSVRPKGIQTLGTRTETKNLNSFKFIEEAILLEAERQIDLLEGGGTVVQETRLYDGETKRARSMRSKEDANDYRYFPCPDLLPVVIDADTIERIRGQMPELPDARRARFIDSYGLSAYDAGVLTAERAVADYFEQVAQASGEAKLAANWVMGDLSASLNKAGIAIADSPVTPRQLAGLISRIKDNTISSKIAKQVFDAMWAGEGEADAVIEARGLKQVTDTGAIEALIDGILAQHPEQVAQYHAADEGRRKKLFGFFVGPIMKATKGQASPALVNEILTRKLNN